MYRLKSYMYIVCVLSKMWYAHALSLEIDGDKKLCKSTRRGAGSQALPVIKELLSKSENWFTISSCQDYHFPDVFREPAPARLGYCSDITQLPNYEESDSDFIFSDIQLGKGKARNHRTVSLNVNGTVESVIYRIVYRAVESNFTPVKIAAT